MEPFQDKKFVGIKAVLHWLDLSESTVRRSIKEKRFPQPINVAGAMKFSVDDLMTWAAALRLGIVIDPRKDTPPPGK